jgi:hypothetical protein
MYFQQALVTWIRVDPETRKASIPQLLNHVKLPLLGHSVS